MAQRLAILVDSQQQLCQQLQQFISAQTAVSGVYHNLDTLACDSVANSQLAQLAQRWVGGDAIDWQQVFAYDQRQQVHLPNYPFQQQRYWLPVEQTTALTSTVATSTAAVSHPLLQHNRSDFAMADLSFRLTIAIDRWRTIGRSQ